ncbi:MAG: DUF6702 family protein [Ekhidna sp.]
MISTLLFIAHLFVHPFHVSVSDIKYKKDQKAIQISTRIFLDDLEVSLRSYSGNEKLNITAKSDWDLVNEHLKNYMLENLRISNEKGEMEANYIGAEIEEDVMWVYLEIEKVKKLKTVKVLNSLLMESFSDQENMVHFRAFDKVKSERIRKGNLVRVFDWD